MTDDKEHSIFFEVVYCYHPTDFDKVGCDGLYIKEVKKIDNPKTAIKYMGKGKIYPCFEEVEE